MAEKKNFGDWLVASVREGLAVLRTDLARLKTHMVSAPQNAGRTAAAPKKRVKVAVKATRTGASTQSASGSVKGRPSSSRGVSSRASAARSGAANARASSAAKKRAASTGKATKTK